MKGFTLLEVVIAAGGALIIGTMLLSIMINHNGVFYKQSSLVGEGLSINTTTQKIEETIRQAAVVSSGYPEVSPTYITGTSVLVLKLPALSTTGILANVYDYAVITRDSSNPKILRYLLIPDNQSVRPQVNTVLTNLIKSIQFSYLDNNRNPVSPTLATTVGLTLTVLSKTGSIGTEQSSSTTTSLRNLDI